MDPPPPNPLIISGQTSSGLTILAGEVVQVYQGGVAAAFADQGLIEVFSGGLASDTAVGSGGVLDVAAGGEAIGETVSSHGVVLVFAGGTLSSSVVSSGGRLILQGSDTAEDVTVASGGVLDLALSVAYGQSFTVPIAISGPVFADGVTVLAGGTVIYGSAPDYGTVILPAGALASAVSILAGGMLEGAGVVVGVTRMAHGPDPNAVGGVVSGVTLGAAFDPGGLTVAGSADGLSVRNGQLSITPSGTLSGALVGADGTLVLRQGSVVQGVTLEHGGVIEISNLSATSAQLAGAQLEVFSGGVIVDSIGLAGNTAALQLTSSVVDGPYGVFSTFISATQAAVRADFEGGGVSDILIENTAGAVVVGQVGAGLRESYLRVAGLGPEWSILGAGAFQGGGRPDFLMVNTAGALVVGAVAGGQTAFTRIGAIGSGSNVKAEFDDFGAGGQSGFLVEAANGALQLGAVVRGNLDYTPLGGLGPEWSILNGGDFFGDGKAGFLMESTNGAVVVGELGYPNVFPFAPPQDPVGAFDTATVTYAQVAALGPEWSIVESGDFLGDGKTDFLMKNTNGALVVGEVGPAGKAGYTTLGGLGAEWRFAGAGDVFGTGRDDFLIENTAGALVAGMVSSGHAIYVQVGALGPEWKFHG